MMPKGYYNGDAFRGQDKIGVRNAFSSIVAKSFGVSKKV